MSNILNNHYLTHKEITRSLVHQRVEYFNQFYNFAYNQIRIKNQKTLWGSCSSKKNLNFNYKLLFLPRELQDYIIVHEMCHLQELNHSQKFWDLVGEALPDYRKRRKQLRTLEKKLFTEGNFARSINQDFHL